MVEKWKLALREFLKKYEDNDDVTGAILCGSYATNTNNEYSDINVYLVLKSGCYYKEMGCTDSNSYLIEYFIDTLSGIEKRMEEEYLNGKQKTANMLAYGKVIYDLDGSASRIQTKALEYIDRKLKVAYEEAKKDPYFKELTDSINLSDDELMKHTSLFEDSKDCLLYTSPSPRD